MATHVCPWWLAYTFDNPLRKLFHVPARMFAPYLKAGQTAVDIGCGLGYFSLGMARIVGDTGRVYSFDLQERMLDGLKKRAARAGLNGRITPRLCRPDTLEAQDLAGQVDMVLTFWMMHEVPDIPGLLAQIWDLLRPGAGLFLAEPKMHVTEEDFAAELDLARQVDFKMGDTPEVRLSRAAWLVK